MLECSLGGVRKLIGAISLAQRYPDLRLSVLWKCTKSNRGYLPWSEILRYVFECSLRSVRRLIVVICLGQRYPDLCLSVLLEVYEG